MNRKYKLIWILILASLVLGLPVQAQSFAVQKEKIEAVDKSLVNVEVSAQQVEDEWKLTATAPGLDKGQVEADIWSLEDKSDKQTVLFERKEGDIWEASLKNQDLPRADLFVAWRLVLQDGRKVEFKPVTFVWDKVEAVPSSSFSSASSSSSSTSSVTSVETSPSSLIPVEPRRETTPATASVSPTGHLSIENVNTQAGTFDAYISQVYSPKGVKAIRVAIWSEVDGQDDIIWYVARRQADGRFKVSVDKKNHKNSTGIYHAHLYYTLGTDEFIGMRTATVDLTPKPTGHLSLENVNVQAGTFDAYISQVYSPKGVKAIRVAIWSEVDGQDDIIWYVARRQADGRFKVSVDKKNHKNSTGIYHAHLYYTLGTDEFIGMRTATVDLTPQPTGQLSIENVDTQAGTFDAYISQVYSPKGVKAIRVAIWSEVDGQDDIIWYVARRQADGRFKVSVDKKNHKNSTGIYHAHLYYTLGTDEFIGMRTATVDLTESQESTITIQTTDAKLGHFDVMLTNVTGMGDRDQVLLPIWSDVNGQDDIVWYVAQKQGTGRYKVSVQAANHNYSQGTYHVHAYKRDANGGLSGLGHVQVQVAMTQTTPHAKIRVENVDNTYGFFDVVVSDIFAPKGLTKVMVPVWAEVNGQQDMIWYEAGKQADGSYRVTVQIANHHWETGTYHAHLYLEMAGQLYGVGGIQTAVSYTKKLSGRFFVDVSSHNGELSVSDYRALAAQGISGVVVKLTESTTYRNPLAESQIRNAQAAGLKVSVYHYSHFTSVAEAQAEARYFVKRAKELGLSPTTLMVNDIEEDKSRTNVNVHMKAWEAEMRRLGYQNLVHYVGASWIDVNTLGFKGPIETGQFGLSNFWVAQYPYAYSLMTPDQALAMSMHSGASAWQFTSSSPLLPGRSNFDVNIDYRGRFTN